MHISIHIHTFLLSSAASFWLKSENERADANDSRRPKNPYINHVHRHGICTHIGGDMCINIHTPMRTDMCTVCAQTCVDMRADMCAEMCANMCADKCRKV